MLMCTVQKWHTSSRRISLHRADCLAKINHAGWRGCVCWRFHTCTDHRSRWPLSSCTRRPARPATCHPSTWRPAESTRLPRTSTCVRDRPIGLTRNPVTDIGSPLTWTPIAYRAPAAVYGEYGPPYAAQPVYVDRAPAYPERLLRSRALLRPGALLRAGIRLCAGICAAAAAARALPCAGTMRRRLWQVGLLRLKHARTMGGARRYPSPLRARIDGLRGVYHRAGRRAGSVGSTHPTR